MKYRIKQVITGNTTLFYVQYRFLFIWLNFTYSDMNETGIPISFKTFQSAKNYIELKREKKEIHIFNIN